MKKLIHYLLTAIIGLLGFSCKTTQKAIDQEDQKKIIEEPDVWCSSCSLRNKGYRYQKGIILNVSYESIITPETGLRDLT